MDFVEQGVTGGEELLAAAHDYLDPLVDAGVDTLILGCTHYPLLTGVISYVMGDAVTLVSSAEECAKDVYKLLAGLGLMREAASRPTRSPPPAAPTSSPPPGAGSSARSSSVRRSSPGGLR